MEILILDFSVDVDLQKCLQVRTGKDHSEVGPKLKINTQHYLKIIILMSNTDRYSRSVIPISYNGNYKGHLDSTFLRSKVGGTSVLGKFPATCKSSPHIFVSHIFVLQCSSPFLFYFFSAVEALMERKGLRCESCCTVQARSKLGC